MNRPQARRPFDLSPLTPATQSPLIGTPGQDEASQDEDGGPPSRTRSILNLTSSTLLGIYSDKGYYTGDRDEAGNLYGSGIYTPVDSSRMSVVDVDEDESEAEALAKRSKERRESLTSSGRNSGNKVDGRPVLRRRHGRFSLARVLLRIVALGPVGAAYGALVARLKANSAGTLLPVSTAQFDHGLDDAVYLCIWAAVAIAVGTLFPWLDEIWAGEDATAVEGDGKSSSKGKGSWAPVWNDTVRAIGVCIGVAFAIVSSPSTGLDPTCGGTYG